MPRGGPIATASLGGGVTLASTFADSLGLSVHQQRIGFAIGVILMLGSLVFFLYERRLRPGHQSPLSGEQPASATGGSVANKAILTGPTTVYGDFNMGAQVHAPTEPKEPARPQVRFLPAEFPESTVKAPPQYPGSVGRFFVVRVTNDPPLGVAGAAASNVRAYLTVSTPDGQTLHDNVAARWTHKAQAPDLSEFQPLHAPELSEADLPPNGAPFGIDTFVYLRKEREFHLWTQAGLGGPIQVPRFIVSVRVRGTNVDMAESYEVDATPENPFDGFKVSHLSAPPIPSRASAPAAASPANVPYNPVSHANLLQSNHDQKKLRNAMRCIAEDELANLDKPRLEDLLAGRAAGMLLATAQWSEHGELIREMPNPQPYQACAAAYRSLRDLGDKLAIEGRQHPLSEADLSLVRKAFFDVDHAIDVLRANQP